MWDDDLELDFDRFEYSKIETFGGDSYYVKVRCRHRYRVDVNSVVHGGLLAQWCVDCNTQLPAGYPD